MKQIDRNVAKIAGRFCIVFQMNEAGEISNFQQYQTKFWDQYIPNEANPETFSFWVNYIFAEKKSLI